MRIALLHKAPLTTVLHPLFFFFNDTATTEIYTLSLHDALPISSESLDGGRSRFSRRPSYAAQDTPRDRKSTRLNSSHSQISYAVFCLKKKKTAAALSVAQAIVVVLDNIIDGVIDTASMSDRPVH